MPTRSACRETFRTSVHFPLMLAVSPSDRVFILTGAGVSAESGIPTFRGVGGLWRNYRIEEIASPGGLAPRSPAGVGVLIPCVGVWLRQPNRIRRTSLSPNLKTRCKIAFSSAPRTWTTFTSRQVREMSPTCTESFSRAVATLAAALLLTTRVSTSRQPRFPGANAAVRFARTFAGLAKYRLNWIEFIVR